MSEVAETAFATEGLASFVADTGMADLGSELRHEAKRSLLNFFGCALGVVGEPVVETAVRVLAPFSGPAAASLIGRAERLDMPGAAFVNAVAANYLDFDDTHLDTVIHPTAPVAAPALALAEARGLSGAEALLAFALGAEVALRLGNAVSPGHYARGWHITATCGVFGAAAAAAKLLGLTAEQTAHALGIAASQSAGLVENLAAEAKNVAVGNAARNGLLAAFFARQGYGAAAAAIEGPLGWARAAGDAPRLPALTEGLGEGWELAKNTYKPYPSGIVMHAVIDACLDLRQRFDLSADAVEAVTVKGDALLLARGDRAVGTERDARVSIHHAVAAPLLTGAAGVPEFSEPFVSDPATLAMRAKVMAELDASLPKGAAAVTIRTVAGETVETTVRHARGSLDQPLGDREIESKVRALTTLGGAKADVDGLIEAVWSLDTSADVGALMRLAAAPA
ncbi:MAG: MmgE/PrpD family protein [Alphaproteobacteria bacterium]|jgi:2-methylcitrate dehydratase PrpD|nr:MmgE/PrpD family protein [Alphaproteobacteria bacterium]